MGGAVDPGVGHRQAPLEKPRIERLEVREAPADERIALDVLDPALDLALGLRPVVAAESELGAVEVHPVLERRVPGHAARGLVLDENDRARIVVEQPPGPAPEVLEGPLVPVEQRSKPSLR